MMRPRGRDRQRPSPEAHRAKWPEEPELGTEGTNPSLVAKTGREFETVLRKIAFPPSPSVPVMAA